MAQPVTPHDHIVAQAARQHASHAAGRQISEELAAQKLAETERLVAELQGGQPS